jgi:hypothetical protein
MARTDQRTRDLAQVIHEQHGDQAVAEALARARNWREAEDDRMAALWMQVAEECRKLVICSNERRSRFAQTALPERMDENRLKIGGRGS